MTEDTTANENIAPRRFTTRAKIGAGIAALLVAGGAIGATGVAMTRPAVSMAPATPVAIGAMPADSLVTVKGRVLELYGNRAIIGDGSGKTLVDLGRPDWTGLATPLVNVGDAITVQGMTRDGSIRAMFLVGANGKTVAVGRMGRHGGDHGPGGHGRDKHHEDRNAVPPQALGSAAIPAQNQSIAR
jgi:hypothetical protein